MKEQNYQVDLRIEKFFDFHKLKSPRDIFAQYPEIFWRLDIEANTGSWLLCGEFVNKLFRIPAMWRSDPWNYIEYSRRYKTPISQYSILYSESPVEILELACESTSNALTADRKKLVDEILDEQNANISQFFHP